MAAADQTILIVGAGQAGATAAASLRAFGFPGRIVMAGAEGPTPYERPPLSKAMLSELGTANDIRVHPPGFYEEKAIEFLSDSEVSDIDAVARQARFAEGRIIGYDQCLIATGGRARAVPGLPPGGARVHYLRSVDDALRLREGLRQHASVLIVGGGFLGLEVASTARRMGLRTTVLEGAPRVLARAVPAAFSQWLQDRIAADGVELHLNATCGAFSVDGDSVTAILGDSERIVADLVVVAAGLEPNVDLAKRAGLAIHEANRGIRIDARCATSAPHIFAAGDCTSQFHPHVGLELRLESWQSANEQARLAAAAMTGGATAGLAAPWFWTDQFDCNLQVLGVPVAGLTYHCRGTHGSAPQAPRFILLGANDAGQILHVIAVNAGGDLRQLKAIVDGKTPCDPTALCDTATPLRQLVRAALEPSL